MAAWPAVEEGHLGGRSAGTERSYRVTLAQWRRWCEVRGLEPLFEVQRLHAQAYVDELRKVHRQAPKTIARKASTISGAYRFAVDEGILGRNPFANIRLPRIDKRKPRRILSVDELQRFLTAAAAAPDIVVHAVFHTMAASGMRVQAACDADVADYFVDEGVPTLVTDHEKGDKTGVHVLAPVAAQVLDDYLAGRRTGPLFVHPKRGGPINQDWVRYRCKVVTTAAGIRAGVHPHMLRSTWVTHAGDAGIDLAAVQDGAGHADPATTRGYDANRTRFDATAAAQLEAFRRRQPTRD